MFILYKKIGDFIIMKKFARIFVSVILVITALSGCSSNSIKSTSTVEITAQNFEQYFDVSSVITDFEQVSSFMYEARAKLIVTIIPKQTIHSGSVNVELTGFLDRMECEYTDESCFLHMPVQFSPTQTYTKTISLSGTYIFSQPTPNIKMAEASGTIEI